MSLTAPDGLLDCANSGTTMRLTLGVLAGSPFRALLTGDESLRLRPMERVARPLRAMGATLSTRQGGPPIEIEGAPLTGVDWTTDVPSAQVKGAVLLAGLVARGTTTVREPVTTRDHTERILGALGAPVGRLPGLATVRAFQHEGFEASVPGDLSSALFLVAAAVLTHGHVTIEGTGLNPTRTAALGVMQRLGAAVMSRVEDTSAGEPWGTLEGAGRSGSPGTCVAATELPLVIDEVPALAAVAVHAAGETRFEGAGELRVKESDRLEGLAEGLRELGGEARVEGDDLVISGGGLRGGRTGARGDHRLAMAFAVAALAARGPCEIDGAESAAVSYPGFFGTLRSLGAAVELRP